jgi:ATP-binding cassette subfamily B protein
MLAFALATLVLNITGNRLAAIASSRLAHDLRHDLFVKTLELDTSATDRLGLASLTSRLTSDTYNVATFFGRMQRMGMRAPMILIGGVIITFTLDVRLALIFLLVLPLVALTVYLVTKKTVPIYKKEQKILDDMVRRVDETASGIRVIKALSKVEFEKSRFNKTAENLSNEEIKAGRISSLTTPVNDLIFYFGFCIVVSIGAVISATTGEEMSGTLLAFMTYFTMVLNGMLVMSRMFVQMSKATASAARIEEVLLTEREMKVEPSDASTDYKNADEPFIVFDNVSFSYGGRRATSRISHSRSIRAKLSA